MSLPILIISGSSKSRRKQAEHLAADISSTFDTIIVDTKQAFGISDVRSVNEQLARRPFESSHQTVILLEAQNLTLEAQNALLKNLEEVSESAKIILTAPSAESLLSTITSRCQRLALPWEEEEPNWRLFENFLKEGFYQRYLLAASLDIDAWLVAWRAILLSSLGVANAPFQAKGNQRKILNYVRLICKARDLQRRKASQKLLKTILLLEAPLAAIRRQQTANSS